MYDEGYDRTNQIFNLLSEIYALQNKIIRILEKRLLNFFISIPSLAVFQYEHTVAI